MSSSIVEIGIARIETSVATKRSDIDRLIKTFLSNNKNSKKVIGLDTERSLKSRKQNKTALLQLCDGDHCLIVQLLAFDDVILPVSLFNFLNLCDFTFVGIGIHKTLTMLEIEFGLTCKHAVEIGPYMLELTNKTADDRFLISNIVSTQKPTTPVFEDWDKTVLNKNQIKLATSNAYAAFGIGNTMFGGFGF